MTSPGNASIGFLLRFGGGAKGESFGPNDGGGGELVAPELEGYVASGALGGGDACDAGGGRDAGVAADGAGCGGTSGSGSGGAARAAAGQAITAMSSELATKDFVAKAAHRTRSPTARTVAILRFSAASRSGSRQ
jgi:hypothetical protein